MANENEQLIGVYRPQVKTANGMQDLPLDAQTVQGIDVTNTANLINGAGFNTTPIPPAPGTAGVWKLIGKTVGQDITYQWVQDPGLPCDISYDSVNEQLNISNVYGIFASVMNGSVSGPYTIVAGSTATLTLTADTGFELPVGVAVAGASYTYTRGTGTIELSNATANVTVAAVCTEVVE